MQHLLAIDWLQSNRGLWETAAPFELVQSLRQDPNEHGCICVLAQSCPDGGDSEDRTSAYGWQMGSVNWIYAFCFIWGYSKHVLGCFVSNAAFGLQQHLVVFMRPAM